MVALMVALLAIPPATASDWTFDANARVRVESRRHTTTFDRSLATAADDDFAVTRLRVGGKYTFSAANSVYLQLQDTRELGSARGRVPFAGGAEGDDPLDLQQAFLHVGTPGAVWTIGRQRLSYADERLVGPSDWSNFSRVFDAALVRIPQVGRGLDFFAGSVVQVQPGGRTGWRANRSSRDDTLFGAYARFDPARTMKFEPFVFVRNSREDRPYGSAGQTARPYDVPMKIATAGWRWAGGVVHANGQLEFDLDLAGQAGEARSRQSLGGNIVATGPAWLTHRAWAGHAGVGYATTITGLPLRIYFEANRASGDHDPADGRSDGFFNLFPGNHKYYGTMDVFTWRNMREVAVAVSTTVRRLKIQIEQHEFSLDSVHDTWVRPLNAQARRAPRRAGRETDLIFSMGLGKHVTLDFGGSYFAAGSYLSATGAASDARVAYVQFTTHW